MILRVSLLVVLMASLCVSAQSASSTTPLFIESAARPA